MYLSLKSHYRFCNFFKKICVFTKYLWYLLSFWYFWLWLFNFLKIRILIWLLVTCLPLPQSLIKMTHCYTKWYCPVSMETINISHVVLRLLWSRFSSRLPEVYCKTYGNIYSRVSFLIKMKTPPATLFKNGDLAQVFSCEFCEIFKNAILLEQLWWLLLLDQLWWLLL